jgi:hypothetical protein
MRKFETGATRNDDSSKYDYEGFLAPRVLHRYAQYMHKHRKQADGNVRDSDNWQKGIESNAYMKSLVRHTLDLWAMHRGEKRFDPDDGHEYTKAELCCAVMFNVMGYLFELLRPERSRKKKTTKKK